jgi:hypothetical protein
MKAKIVTFVHNLLIYDYILFGAVFALFILFLILSILLRRRLGIALFFLLFGFTVLIAGPTLGYIEMHKYLFKNSVELVSQKRLTFVKAIVVHGVVKNESKFHFQECKVTASVYKLTPNRWKNYIFRLKPLKKSILVIHDIPKKTSKEFKLFVEPFSYSKDYNISLGANCR